MFQKCRHVFLKQWHSLSQNDHPVCQRNKKKKSDANRENENENESSVGKRMQQQIRGA
jgi:hypothetical protein